MQANRMYSRRGVDFLMAQHQFMDIGSGSPTSGNVHEVAQQANPAARVVDMDNDPSAVVYSAAMLRDNSLPTIIQGDVRQPQPILEHMAVRAPARLGQASAAAAAVPTPLRDAR